MSAASSKRSQVAEFFLKLEVQECLFAAGLLISRIVVKFGAKGAAVFIGLTLLYCYVRREQFVRMWTANWVPLLFPAFALLSILWAEYQGITARSAVQMTITAIAGLMLSQSPRPRAVLAGLFIAFTGYTLLSVAAGNTAAVGLRGSALVGIGGEAKNFFAESAGVAALLSITMAVIALQRRRPILVLGALGCAVVSVYAVQRANSAGATVSVAVGVAALLATLATRRARPSIKIVGVITAIAAAIILLLFKDQILGLIASSFKKDPGLTGRDYLWQHAYREIAQRPYLGIGYYGFWHEGNPQAVGIWRYFNIRSGATGFTFHSAYIQTLVELGYFGLGVLLFSWVVGAFGLLRRFVLTPGVPICFWISYFCCELAKSGVEPIRPGALIAPTIMLFIALGFANSAAPQAAAGSSTRGWRNAMRLRQRGRDAPSRVEEAAGS
jgi:exopolysaccharide production protein ExoQ